MKSLSTEPEAFESTYALIVRSEEKQRSMFETLIYTVLVVSSLFALMQFGREAVTMPVNVVRNSVTAPAPTPAHHQV